MNKRSLRGSLLLTAGSVIWGAAFVAQRVGMEHMGPFTFTGIRMLLAAIMMLPVIALADRFRNQRGDRRPKRQGQWKAGLICGLFLFVATSLQQIGLVSTSAGKAGFITALYVVLVPLAAWLFRRQNPGRIIWISVAAAVAALYLLCLPKEAVRIQQGDVMLLGCAICFTGQILSVDRFAREVDGVRLSCMEFFVTGTLGMLVALFTEEITSAGIREAMIPILYTGIMSGAAGYTLQILGQRDTNPTVASLLMCLESVFAVLTGVLLLGEKMTAREAAGCVLMLAAVLLAQLAPWLNGILRKRRSGAPG